MCKLSKIYGITWNKQHEKWYVKIGHNYKEYSFGYYDDLEEAKVVLAKARLQYPTRKRDRGPKESYNVTNTYVTVGPITKIIVNDNIVTTIDTEDLTKLQMHIFRYRKPPDKRQGYICTKNNLAIHRLILPKVEGRVIDHIDGNTLDNRKSNLRYATHSQNVINSNPSRIKKHSKFKGVTKSRIKWHSQIKCDNKIYRLGSYPLTEAGELAAAKAYDVAAVKFFGPYAKTNLALGLY